MSLMQLVEVPVPAARKNELLLKLEVASINPLDWKLQKGMLRPFLPRKLPFIPGNHPYSSLSLGRLIRSFGTGGWI